EVLPLGGAKGTVSFLNPATGTPPNPSNYIFDGHGLGIAASNPDSNFGSGLSANDFDANAFNNGPLTVVPKATKNLLQVDFSASADASGTFGVFAREGRFTTSWTGADFDTNLFDNVPDNTNDPNSPQEIQIGTITVRAAAVPEPATIVL